MARSRALANLQPAIDGIAIGQVTPAAVAATTLAASGAVSGAGFTNLFASPPAIGGTAAAAVSATSLTATGTAILAGAAVMSGDRIIRQGAPASYSAAATLTAADIVTASLIQYTGAAANLQLPTGAQLDAVLVTASNDRAVEFAIVNTGSGAATLTVNTGITIVGVAAISQSNSAIWRLRRTAAATYVAYRLAG